MGKTIGCLWIVVLRFCCEYHLTEVTAFRNFGLAYSTAFSVTNRAPFDKRSFVVEKPGLEKQVRRGIQSYEVMARMVARVNLQIVMTVFTCWCNVITLSCNRPHYGFEQPGNRKPQFCTFQFLTKKLYKQWKQGVLSSMQTSLLYGIFLRHFYF